MKKRVLSLLLTGAVLVGLLSGCGTVKENEENNGASQPAQADQSSQNTNTSSEEGNTDKPAEGKTLVVYFSATGTTEKVAGMVAGEGKNLPLENNYSRRKEFKNYD